MMAAMRLPTRIPIAARVPAIVVLIVAGALASAGAVSAVGGDSGRHDGARGQTMTGGRDHGRSDSPRDHMRFRDMHKGRQPGASPTEQQ
jgi:hypothetical protein